MGIGKINIGSRLTAKSESQPGKFAEQGLAAKGDLADAFELERKLIRQQSISKRNSLGDAERRQKTLKIIERLFRLPEFKESKVVMLYSSIKSEVSTQQMINEALHIGKVVVLPKVKDGSLELIPFKIKDADRELLPGHFGVLEPSNQCESISPGEIDLVIVPGVAFDIFGTRLGYGKGYYDNFLKTIKKRTPIVALSFEAQIVCGTIQKRVHDISVDKIITESRVINCN